MITFSLDMIPEQLKLLLAMKKLIAVKTLIIIYIWKIWWIL